MHRKPLLFVFLRTLAIEVAVLFLFQIFVAEICTAQFEPASPPIADPADTRFSGVEGGLDFAFPEK